MRLSSSALLLLGCDVLTNTPRQVRCLHASTKDAATGECRGAKEELKGKGPSVPLFRFHNYERRPRQNKGRCCDYRPEAVTYGNSDLKLADQVLFYSDTYLVFIESEAP